IYSEATEQVQLLAEETGIGVGETQAGKGSLPFDHPLCLGAIGASGNAHANALARDADIVVGIGTRYTDFTTASRTLFPSAARFVNINVAEFDAYKHAGIALQGDARETLQLLRQCLGGWSVSKEQRDQAERAATVWRSEVKD